MLDLPGPSDYIPDITKDFDQNKVGGEKNPFGVNVKRFNDKQLDNGVPGAGTYKLLDSCEVKESKFPHASMRSTVKKGLDQVIGRDNPGIGEYDM
jgi:hypothetical protein